MTNMKRFSLELDESLYRRLKMLAVLEDEPAANIVRKALDSVLRAYEDDDDALSAGAVLEALGLELDDDGKVRQVERSPEAVDRMLAMHGLAVGEDGELVRAPVPERPQRKSGLADFSEFTGEDPFKAGVEALLHPDPES